MFLLALLALAPGARAAEDGVRAVIVYEEAAFCGTGNCRHKSSVWHVPNAVN